MEQSIVFCFECGAEAIHNHHVVPVVLGGSKTIPLCGGCHGKIHGKDFTNWRNLQQAGIAAARAAGKFFGGLPGRMVRMTPEKQEAIKAMKAEGVPITEISKTVGLSRPTVYKVLGRQDPSAP